MNRSLTAKGASRTRYHDFSPVFCIAFVFFLTLFSGASAEALTAQDVVAPAGCAMAHCDQSLTDNALLSAPSSSQVVVAWRDTTVNGSGVGIGCSSNGETVVCSFRSTSSKPAELRAYDRDGKILWSSTAFSSSNTSAPLVDQYGGVVAAGQNRIIRFGPTGAVVWSRSTAGGYPISSNVTDGGDIVLATLNGPVSAYSYTTGDMLARLRLNATVQYNGRSYTGYFDTLNVPAVRGNRIYVSTQFKYGSFFPRTLPIGRLYAIDLVSNPTGSYSLEAQWNFEFKAPSGSSPTLGTVDGNTVVYFDGSGIVPSGTTAPQAFAVKDLGTSGVLLWNYALATKPEASPAKDPRGGLWYYAFRRSQILRLDETDGHLVQTINVDTFIADSATFVPSSVMTITGKPDAPVMILAASSSSYSRTYIVAIDLTVDAGSLLWSYRIDEGKGTSGAAMGQFPIQINSEDKPVVVFSTYGNGVWALTSP